MTARGAAPIELWMPVHGYDGAFEVSNLGRVRSLGRVVMRRVGKGPNPDKLIPHRSPGRMLNPGVGPNGYPSVSLGRKTYMVHALVLSAFVGPRPDGCECRHLDGNKRNAFLGNLRWGTRKENCADMADHGTRTVGERYRSAKLTDATAREIRSLRGRVSQSKMAKMFNVSPAAVQAVIDGRTWKHVV